MTTAEQLDEFRKSHPVQYKTISGNEWAFIDSGSGGDTIVVLPGVFGIGARGAETVFPVITELESYTRIISIGYPINATIEEIIDGLKTILDNLEVTEATFLSREDIRFSLLFLAKYPEGVKNIILTNFPGYNYLNPNFLTRLIFNLVYYSSVFFYKLLPQNFKIKRAKKRINYSLKNYPDLFWIPYLIGLGEANEWIAISNFYRYIVELRKRKCRITPESFIGWTGRVLVLNSETVESKKRISIASSRPLFKNTKINIIKNAGTSFWITHLKAATNEVLNFLGIEVEPLDSIDITGIPDKINNNNNVPRKKSMAPYLLGILCLIPLIGAFVGFGLLLYALIYYKDKWLAVIGAFGIVFTIVVYSLLFYVGFKSNIGKKGFVMVSQMQLNNLVKNVEFYKLQYGEYPESLQQLRKADAMAPVNDPIHTSVLKKNMQLYNYERVGDKYLLFSYGPDGIPNTKDDLYPQFVMFNNSQIGWIKSK